MRIKIDTETKVIQLEQSAKLTELFALIEKIFPNDEWKQYSIEAVQYINGWYNPITIIDYPAIPYWWQIQPQWTICETTKGQNTYCIQTN